MIEGEINNFIIVWIVATILFWYSYTIGKVIPKGRRRLVSLIPPIFILPLLPVRLTSLHLGGFSSLFLAWLSTFKLLLFAFAKGPLSSNPPLSLPQFLLLAPLPIKFLHNNHTNKNQIKVLPLNWRELVVMSILSYLFFPCYEKKESFHPLILMSLYCIHMYTACEIFFALIATIARKIVQVELEQTFNKPYLSTSLQDFWGRRWNIIVTRILHPAVYEPIMKASSHVIGRKWAPLPAVMATFTVSGLMHDLIFYYMKREKTTWEAWEPCWDSMCFFFIHGVCVALQIAYKKIFKPKQPLLPRVVSCTLTVAFVVSTILYLFVPALVRCGVTFKQKI